MANISSFFGGSGGGGGCLPWYSFTHCSPTSWTAPSAGEIVVHVIGAGAAGTNHYVGGGAGGYARKEITVTQGAVYCMLIGCSNSCCSRFCGGGHDLIGYGGCQSSCCQACSLGGTASGGDVNWQGGWAPTSCDAGGGGGAVAIFGVCNQGGGVNITGANVSAGGAGVGQPGGSPRCAYNNNDYHAPGAGGGSSLTGYGPTTNPQFSCTACSNKGGEAAGALQADICGCMFWKFIPSWGAGGQILEYSGNNSQCGVSYNSINPGIGGGGAGGGVLFIPQDGGMFAGGGGTNRGNGCYLFTGGSGGWPGGGGGGSGNAPSPGQGGRGGIFIEYLSLG